MPREHGRIACTTDPQPMRAEFCFYATLARSAQARPCCTPPRRCGRVYRKTSSRLFKSEQAVLSSARIPEPYRQFTGKIQEEHRLNSEPTRETETAVHTLLFVASSRSTSHLGHELLNNDAFMIKVKVWTDLDHRPNSYPSAVSTYDARRLENVAEHPAAVRL